MPRRKKESFLLEILDEQEEIVVDIKRIRTICEKMLGDAAIRKGRLGIVLVDSDTIRQYNRDFLRHDYPTDVISFPIEERLHEGHLEAEVLVCTQIALECSAEFSWTPQEETLLYVVHGVLHLVGFDDTTPEARVEMRKKEKEYLAFLGIDVPDFEDVFDNEPEGESKKKPEKKPPKNQPRKPTPPPDIGLN